MARLDQDAMQRGVRRAGLLVLAGMLGVAGCEDDGNGLGDVGLNDPNVVVVMGDSITSGIGASQPYPSRMSALTPRVIINEGISGEHAYEGLRRVNDVLARYAPGQLVVLYGANDLLHFRNPLNIVDDLRDIVRAAKANGTRVIIGTLLPQVRTHAFADGAVNILNAHIKQMAQEEGISVVDLNAAFGNRDADEEPFVLDADDLLLWDGLHPNDAGNELIAQRFASAVG